MNKCKSSGFTLIELSIVLVIIGLIIGGIVVGRDLITASQVRGTIGQLDQYRAAVMTFKTKYNSLPGDLSSDKAATLGLQARAGTANLGDENGYIRGCDGTSRRLGCENALFWDDLNATRLISGNYNQNLVSSYVHNASNTTITEDHVTDFLPAAKIAGNYITIVVDSDDHTPNDYKNHFLLTGISSITSSIAQVSLQKRIPSPLASTVDQKIDDGKPKFGHVRSTDVPEGGIFNQYDATLPCEAGNYWGPYATTNSLPGCSLVIEAGF